MASIYPSLEDMKVDQMAQAERAQSGDTPSSLPYPTRPLMPTAPGQEQFAHLYPSLSDYMGLELTPELVAQLEDQEKQVALQQPSGLVPSASSTHGYQLVAPISGASGALQKAAVSHAIREVTLCKDRDGRVGLRCQEINKGVFVVLVQKNSPAAMAGLRFGDQILQINEVSVAGYDMDKVHDMFRKARSDAIKVAVRDRPFERTVTMHKDSAGTVGFQYRDGKIMALVKDSSAARNGLLTEHHMLEINGQNVVGLKDKETRAIIDECGSVLTVTVMPSFVFEHMMKKVHSSVIQKLMDHSVPDF
ncbi:syntenin-1-like [Pollicipes pollicipes]|uniref:syntenin-1-like n=1 Tax=Pollicipes pollicipes TaxID=41117 RepID=UPI0018858493|nr:syntenin-1-like [Pollicipes pollicipes]XP_037084648.1 syntenin-1-like [Pollicipes pollicipes]